MINIIVAVDKNFGIGKDNNLPWDISEEMKIFRKKTYDQICVVGRKTFETLPELKNRKVIQVSRKDLLFDDVVKEYNDFFVIGGADLYSYVLRNHKINSKIHISFIKNEYDCDTYFDKYLLKDFYILSKEYYNEFDHCEMIYKKYGEYQYLELLKDVLENGEKRVGRNGSIISDFSKHLKFDLREGFPLLTTKKMFLKGIIEELLWFLRGSTNSKELEEKGVNIWRGNSTREYLDSIGLFDYPEGELGPIYGFQWRSFNGKIDQLKYLLEELQLNNSRRALISAWNPCQLKEQALPPCHLIYNFYKSNDNSLSCMMYMRSSDLFLGLPFNIASTALLLMIIARLSGMKAKYIGISICDCHIYEEHIEEIKKQLERECYKFPEVKLEINNQEKDKIKIIETLKFEDFQLNNYTCHEALKGIMK